VQSASYLTIGTGLDRSFDGTSAANQRPNQVLASPYGDGSFTNFLNPKAFVQPAVGTIGTMARSNVRGPGFWNLDMALSRSFQVKEKQRMEVRVEAFNVPNSVRPGAPVTSLSSNQFGQITSAADPRIMQFAVKYAF
jgi:hypothetical protein